MFLTYCIICVGLILFYHVYSLHIQLHNSDLKEAQQLSFTRKLLYIFLFQIARNNAGIHNNADNGNAPESTHNMRVGCGKAMFLHCDCLLYQLGSQGSLFGKFFHGHTSFILLINTCFVVILKQN